MKAPDELPRDRYDGYSVLDAIINQMDVIDGVFDDLLFRLVHGRAVRIYISRLRGIAPIDAERELGKVGIPIGGRLVRGWDASFLVKAKQATWAIYVLRRHGWTVTEFPPKHDSTVREDLRGRPVRAWKDRR